MRIPKITFEKRTFEPKKASAKELLNSINEYFINAPTHSNPGDKEFATGEINFNDLTFDVRPIITDWWTRTFLVSLHGTLTDEQIEIRFQTSAISFLLPIIFYTFFISIFLSESWLPIAWLTIPILILLLVFNALRARKQYKKDRQNHIDFLNKINVM